MEKSDAHTKLDMVYALPINFKIFNDEVFVNYPDNLRGTNLKYINGVSIDNIISEMDNVITYGTLDKRRYELEKSLFNRRMMFGLPSLKNSDSLTYEFITLNGGNKIIIFDKNKNEILKPHIFKPDIYVEQNREDVIKGNDTVLDYAINYCKEQNRMLN